MSWEYAHLVFNHFPIVGAILAVGVILAGWFAGARGVQRVGLALCVVAALLGVPTYVTGNRAEEIAEKWPGVAEAWIEEHESAGKWAFVTTLAAGAASALALVLSRAGRSVPAWAMVLTLVLGGFAVTTLVRTATLGGRIRHPELRPPEAPGAPERDPTGGLQLPAQTG